MEESVAMSEPLPCPSGADWEKKSALAFLTNWPIFLNFLSLKHPQWRIFLLLLPDASHYEPNNNHSPQ